VLSREAVIWSYRLFLGREPESEAVIVSHQHIESIEVMRRAFMSCDEFLLVNGIAGLRDKWVAAPVMGGKYLMWIDLGDRYVSLGCLADSYEGIGTQFVKGVLREGDVFVDIGANVGWYTLLAASIVGDAGRIHCFEPRPQTVDHLAQTIALNRLERRVTLYRYGLSDSDGEMMLVWSPTSDNPGGSHLADDVPPGMHGEMVALKTLDALDLRRLDFLKIDVEGAEMRIFAGGRKTIEQCRPVILSEISPEMLGRVSGASTEAYFSYFAGLGYRCYVIDGERCGEEITAFPVAWGRELLNVGLVPADRPADLVARIFADPPSPNG
jgi:FkbM family methyltransferase